MSVFRVVKTSDYTVMSNHHLKNSELSLRAKGLLSQILSLPDDWDYTIAGLAKINKEGKDAVRVAVQELEKAGYIERRQRMDAGGKFSSNEYVVYECPRSASPLSDFPSTVLPTTEKPSTEEPLTEEPLTENPTELNKDKYIKKNKKERAMPLTGEQLGSVFVEWINATGQEAWSNEDKNLLYRCLAAFYKPRENKKQQPARSETAVKTLLNRLGRLSNGDLYTMCEMLEQSTIAGWKSVFPLSGAAAARAAQKSSSKRRDEEWL